MKILIHISTYKYEIMNKKDSQSYYLQTFQHTDVYCTSQFYYRLVYSFDCNMNYQQYFFQRDKIHWLLVSHHHMVWCILTKSFPIHKVQHEEYHFCHLNLTSKLDAMELVISIWLASICLIVPNLLFLN